MGEYSRRDPKKIAWANAGTRNLEAQLSHRKHKTPLSGFKG